MQHVREAFIELNLGIFARRKAEARVGVEIGEAWIGWILSWISMMKKRTKIARPRRIDVLIVLPPFGAFCLARLGIFAC